MSVTKYITRYLCFYRPQRSCGQGNIFTPVCHSVHRGGGFLPQCMLGYQPPWDHTPPTLRDHTPLQDHTHPPGTRPRGTRPPPLPPGTTPPPGPDPHLPGTTPPPGTRPPPPRTRPPPPRDQTPPGPDPPQKQTPAYGLRAAGTHPTGMHSCYFSV